MVPRFMSSVLQLFLSFFFTGVKGEETGPYVLFSLSHKEFRLALLYCSQENEVTVPELIGKGATKPIQENQEGGRSSHT